MNEFLLQNLMGQLPGMGLFGPMQGPAQPAPAAPGPQMGPMGPPAGPPQPPQASTPLQRLLGIDPTRMSPEAAQRRQALGLIAAGSQLSDDMGSFAGGVGRAILGGQQAVQQLGAQEQQQAMRDALGKLGPDELEKGFQLALQAGDLETANAIRQMITAKTAATQAQPRRYTLSASPGSKQELVDAEGNVIRSIEGGPPLPPNMQLRDMVMEDGTVRTVAVDPRNPTRQIDVGRPVPSTAQGQAAQFAGQALDAHEALSRLGAEGYDTPSYWDAVLGESQDVPILGIFARGALSGDAQQFADARDQFAEMFVRDVSGAAIRPDEARRSARLFIPQAGDSPETVAAKQRRREIFIEQTGLRSGEPQRFQTATEAMDAVFGPDAGGEFDDIPTFEEYMENRRGGGE